MNEGYSGENYRFCKNCGSIFKGTVCGNCGNHLWDFTALPKEGPIKASVQQPQQQKQKKISTGLMIGIVCMTAGLFLLGGLMIFPSFLKVQTAVQQPGGILTENETDNETYYTELEDAVVSDTSYGIVFDTYVYPSVSPDYDVHIAIEYPQITGENIKNEELLNDCIKEEVDYFVDYFEDIYLSILPENGYFEVDTKGYVTYMSEEALSIVYKEQVFSDYFNSIRLYCLNIDIQGGIVMDNREILQLDEVFVGDFRRLCREQNGNVLYDIEYGEIQIWEAFNSGDLILFRTPKGMEVGFNYDNGFVTITLQEYEKYTKTL